MNRTVLFDSPFLLGFEHTRNLIERAAKAAADSYPPYNVEGREDGGVRITLAVAGFSADQLEIQVEGEQLTVTGRKGEAGEDGRDFLHRGIAARGFIRTFVLADGMEVLGADLKNGLLSIDLHRPNPERIVKTISISEQE